MVFGRKKSNMRISSKAEHKARAKQNSVVALATDPQEDDEKVRLAWPISAGMAAMATAVASWLIVVATCLAAWISFAEIPVAGPLKMSVKIWLLAGGAKVTVTGVNIRLAPLGLTLVIVGVGWVICHSLAARTRGVDELSDDIQRKNLVLKMTGAFTGVYALVVLVAAVVAGTFNSTILLPIVLGGVIGLVFFSRALQWHPKIVIEQLTGMRSAISAGLAFMCLVGCAVFVLALIGGRERYAMIQQALSPDPIGDVVLVLMQLAWLPNLVIWAACWASGAGIQAGIDSVITPARTDVGMLPGVPIFGLVPESGPAPIWWLAWVLSAFAAGAISAFLIIRAQKNLRAITPISGAIIGALAGIVTGIAMIALAWLSGGNLGSLRLSNVGPMLAELAVMAPTGMGIGGMITGAVIGWWSARATITEASE